VIVFSHPDHRLHNPSEPHRFGGVLLPPAEVAERAERILRGLESGPFEIRVPDEVPREAIRGVHSDRYLGFLETAHARWREATGGPPDAEAVAYIRPLPGTPWKEPTHIDAQLGIFSNDVDPILAGTWRAALAAASCAHAAAGAVRGGERTAYALSRPPGHHAAPEIFGGYCYLNNTAIAADLLARSGATVAVLDVDTHHGNGTQTVFWERGDVLTLSIHGDPNVHFPYYLGHADEVGVGPGEGANRNFPLPTGTAWPGYRDALGAAVGAISAYGTDALVVALGVDTQVTHGVLALEGDDYRRLGAALAGIDVPTVFVQEGGYEPGVLERDVPAVLTAFLDAG
jgi:acetoin utilization deacetylase AcuC-like enzyme